MSATVLQHPTSFPTEMNDAIAAVIESPRGVSLNDVEAASAELFLETAVRDYLNTHTETELLDFVNGLV